MNKKQPFFVKFLEGTAQEEMEQTKGGKIVTMKYPSDNDENIDKLAASYITHKYPSDSDENVTHKYPSDGDEVLPSDI